MIDLVAYILITAGSAVITVTANPFRIPEANANGGFSRTVATGNVGPYQYEVYTRPPNPAVGYLHMSIALSANQQPVTDAVVNVKGRAADGTTVMGPLRAESNFRYPRFYELNMSLSTPGRWTSRPLASR